MSDGDPEPDNETAAETRRKLGEAIRAAAVEFTDDDDNKQAGIVVGWVVIAETLAPDGEMWLSKFTGDAADEPLARWRVHGYAHSVLHDWPPPDDD